MAHGKEYYRSVLPFDVNLADAEKTDIIFTYFNSVSDTGRVLTEETADGIIDKSLPTVLLIHGWTSDDTSPWFNSLKEGYFNLGSYNVIYINWYKAGSKEYYISCANIVPVGKFIAEFLITSSLSLGSVQIVGFSLGAQLASIIGKRVFDSTGEKIGRITALDPAGPGFEKLKTTDLKLCDNDAEFVDVVHTNIQHYGYTAPLGHVDFYPNGGEVQPGCHQMEKNDTNCSHHRATVYFAESLWKKSKAQESEFTELEYEVTIKVNDNPKETYFGQHAHKNTRGVFYLETNSEAPFLR